MRKSFKKYYTNPHLRKSPTYELLGTDPLASLSTRMAEFGYQSFDVSPKTGRKGAVISPDAVYTKSILAASNALDLDPRETFEALYRWVHCFQFTDGLKKVANRTKPTRGVVHRRGWLTNAGIEKLMRSLGTDSAELTIKGNLYDHPLSLSIFSLFFPSLFSSSLRVLTATKISVVPTAMCYRLRLG